MPGPVIRHFNLMFLLDFLLSFGTPLVCASSPPYANFPDACAILMFMCVCVRVLVFVCVRLAVVNVK